MPSSKQDQLFAEEMSSQVDTIKMGNNTLDAAIDWIQDNLDPDDVFSTKKLEEWAESNGYTED